MEPNTGGGDPCGTRYHCLGDFALVTSGLPMYHLLCLQILSGQEEEARPIHNVKHSVCIPVPQMSAFCETAHNKAPLSDAASFSLPNFGSASVSRP